MMMMMMMIMTPSGWPVQILTRKTHEFLSAKKSYRCLSSWSGQLLRLRVQQLASV